MGLSATVTALALVASTVTAPPHVVQQVGLYASPTGTGTSCTQAQPCGLTQARQQVRSLVGSATGDVVVNLAGGTYRLTDALRFGVADSGQHGHQVIWQAEPGQVPVISGARQVTGFTLVDASKNIYRAPVPVGTDSRQLFVDGVRAYRDRGPANPSGFTVTSTGFATADPSYATWTNTDQVEVVQDNDWKQMRCPLSGITATSSGSALTVDPACWQNNHVAVPNPSFPFNGAGLPALNGISWLENAYQLLGTPGQFFLDRVVGALYYVPRPTENLATADVELPVAQELVDLAGTPGHLAPVNDTTPNAAYAGSWNYSAGRHYGDFGDDVHYTTSNGDSVSYTFTGTGLQILSETNSDEDTADVYVDGVKTQTVNGFGTPRLAQQAIASVTGLPLGTHTVKLVKTDGQYLLVDGFTVIPDVVAPVHDITFSGITFQDTTWTAPNTAGYVDNQAGVLWDPVTHTPIRIPAAVRVHRGQRITFTNDTVTHTGGSGIDLADQTQDSTVSASTVTDTSGIGIAVGEVDDYYQTQPALMTSGNTITGDTITRPGQDYSDAVGVWVGHSRKTTLSHNDIGYTPYSGISIGWGWGWMSDCTLQAKQGLSTPCLHGTTYSGGNAVLDNHVHSVMGRLFDGGPIYTLGGQASGSEFAGNVLSECIDGCNMIYHDEGSSLWNTHDNVIRFGNGSNWVNMWTPTIHDITVHDNYADSAQFGNNGTNVTVTNTTVVSGGNWPTAAQSVVAAVGPHNPPAAVADDDDLRVAYTGSWSSNGSRGLGDLDDGVHHTTTNGDSATITFTGTGITYLSETNSDEGTVGITLDGVAQGTVNANTPTRFAQQHLFTRTGLAPGTHTLTVTKISGTYLLVDGYLITQ